jgi:glutathione synthase/RimK-type ligase-like ATP-grasp enzyme
MSVVAGVRFDPPLYLAMVTCEAHAHLHPDDQALVAALRTHGIHAVPAVWTEPRTDWRSFDAVLVRTAWDYFQRYYEFRGFCERIGALGAVVLNPLPLIVWNSDKRYLLELSARGVPIVPTSLASGRELEASLASRRNGELVVIKPTVSGGAWHTVRGAVGSDALRRTVASLPRHLDYLVQPFVPEIAEHGEWSLLFFGGVFSHAVLKKPAAGDYRVQPDFGGTAAPASPPGEIVVAARRALEAVAALGHRDQAYARVDGVVVDGTFRVMELELIEPLLFLAAHPPAAETFAAHLARRFHALREI